MVEEDVIYQTCPCCHHRFKLIEPGEVKRGLWTLTKSSSFYNRKHLKISTTHSLILHILASRNVPVKAEQLGYAISGIEVEHYTNLAWVHICILRKKLKELGIPDPIETLRARGYKWNSSDNKAGI